MRVIGFLGLGTMGSAMAEQLVSQGYDMIVWNRTKAKADAFAGARVAVTAVDTPKAVAAEADIIITMLGDDASVEEVYFGASGLFSGLRMGSVLMDCSTISPALSRRLAYEAERNMADFLDAPVAGSQPAAASGTLTFMVGGRAEAVENVREVLLAMGRGIVHMGPSGAGSQAKLAHNTVVGIHAAALAEGLALATKAGLDPDKFLDILASGGAASKLLELKREKVLTRDYSSQFSLKFMLKDLHLATGLAGSLGVPTPLLSSVKNVFQIGEAQGLGELDLSAVVQVFEEWTGVTIERAPELPAEQQGNGAKAKGSDRRRARRVELDIPLHLSVYQWHQEGAFSGQQIEAKLHDLSESGLQVRSIFPLAMDMFIVIHFPQEADLPPITGRIVRVEPDGDAFRYGCLLSGLPPFVRIKLEEYLDQKAL